MYSKKLKKLVEEKTNLKFRIKDQQQSKELQEFLFACGITWTREEEDKCDKVKCVDASCLFVDCEFPYGLTFTNNKNLFEHTSAKEYDLEKDCFAVDFWDKESAIVKPTTGDNIVDTLDEFVINIPSESLHKTKFQIDDKIYKLSSSIKLEEVK